MWFQFKRLALVVHFAAHAAAGVSIIHLMVPATRNAPPAMGAMG